MAIAVYVSCNAWTYYKSGYISKADATGCSVKNSAGGPAVNHGVMIVGHQSLPKTLCQTATATEITNKKCASASLTYYAATSTTVA
jgi:hypothetical protein